MFKLPGKKSAITFNFSGTCNANNQVLLIMALLKLLWAALLKLGASRLSCLFDYVTVNVLSDFISKDGS